MTAERLGIFTLLGAGARSADDLSEAVAAKPRGVRMLCDALVSLGLLERNGGLYANSELARNFLISTSPQSQSALVQHAARLYERWGRLYDVVKTGSPLDERAGDPRLLGSEVDFARAMASSGALHAQETVDKLNLVQARHMLDLGGGPGIYAIEFARRFPQLHVVVFDREQTVKVAEENIRKAGLSQRVTVRAGDLFRDDFSGAYDFIWVSNIVHAYSAADNQRLIAKAAQALVCRGQLCVKDFMLEPDHSGPTWACLFALNMLINTPGGDCYSAEEIQGWYHTAGLVCSVVIELTPPSKMLLATKPGA
jgi:SAM-dependent methyltransferase